MSPHKVIDKKSFFFFFLHSSVLYQRLIPLSSIFLFCDSPSCTSTICPLTAASEHPRTGASPAICNVSSPYLFHSSNHPGSFWSHLPSLAKNTLGSMPEKWCWMPKIYLARLTVSVRPNATFPYLALYDRCNDMMLSWNLNSIPFVNNHLLKQPSQRMAKFRATIFSRVIIFWKIDMRTLAT